MGCLPSINWCRISQPSTYVILTYFNYWKHQSVDKDGDHYQLQDRKRSETYPDRYTKNADRYINKCKNRDWPIRQSSTTNKNENTSNKHKKDNAASKSGRNIPKPFALLFGMFIQNWLAIAVGSSLQMIQKRFTSQLLCSGFDYPKKLTINHLFPYQMTIWGVDPIWWLRAKSKCLKAGD